jgi:hypothetical protein
MQAFNMKNAMLPLSGIVTALLFLVVSSPCSAQTESNKPISKNGLIESLKIGGLSQQELSGIVRRRGVEFSASPEIEKELRSVGAGDDLITAVRDNFRGAAAPDQSTEPQAGNTAPRPNAGSGAHRTLSLRDVHSIFIERMPNNLDQYLRAEISKRFNGSLTIVLDRAAADAILTTETANDKDTTKGTVSLVDPSHKVVLWSGAAGDRKMITLDIGHGGQRTVASRLAGQLKKAMQTP